MLQHENCRGRWENTFKYQAENPGQKVPVYSSKNPETNDFKAKWSDDNQGRGSGWHQDAFIVLAQRCKDVKAWREEEKRTAYQRWGAARTLCIHLNKGEKKPEEDNAAEEQEQDDVEVVLEDYAEDDEVEYENNAYHISFEDEEDDE